MWFTSIHPFGDGNGRVARAISEHALFQDFDIPPLFSISTEINENRSDYYEMLAESSRVTPSVDLTNWIKWFAETVRNAQLDAKSKINFVLKKSVFWDYHRNTVLNKRQHKTINKFFEFGTGGLIKNGIKSELYQSITGCSSATATRDLKDMVKKGILVPSESGGRSLRYFINLIEEKNVFKVAPRENSKKLAEVRMDNLLNRIQRNIKFYMGPNAQLNQLVDEYTVLADGEKPYLDKLNELLSQIGGDDIPHSNITP
jgi:hypothetical protein